MSGLEALAASQAVRVEWSTGHLSAPGGIEGLEPAAGGFTGAGGVVCVEGPESEEAEELVKGHMVLSSICR